MYSFPSLLFQHSSQLFPADCLPDYLDESRVRYEKAHRPFRLAVASYPHGLEIRLLFVRSDLRCVGIGSDVVRSLQTFCHYNKIERITIQTILEKAERFWSRHGFEIDTWGGGQWKQK